MLILSLVLVALSVSWPRAAVPPGAPAAPTERWPRNWCSSPRWLPSRSCWSSWSPRCCSTSPWSRCWLVPGHDRPRAPRRPLGGGPVNLWAGLGAVGILVGAGLVALAGFGLLRLPDPLTRATAVSKAASLGVIMVSVGQPGDGTQHAQRRPRRAGAGGAHRDRPALRHGAGPGRVPLGHRAASGDGCRRAQGPSRAFAGRRPRPLRASAVTGLAVAGDAPGPVWSWVGGRGPFGCRGCMQVRFAHVVDAVQPPDPFAIIVELPGGLKSKGAGHGFGGHMPAGGDMGGG